MADDLRTFLRDRARLNPGFREAVIADARAMGKRAGVNVEGHGLWAKTWMVLRLTWVSDGFLALLFIRISVKLRAMGVPLLPTVARRLAIVVAQVHIGAPVILHPGIILPHGQVVIDGVVEIGSGTVITPFVSIGLTQGNYQGPTIGANVLIGTGARILGPLTVGRRATIGANAVVTKDVAEGTTVVGVPARVFEK